MIDDTGVHRTHCCIRHGCKYGEKDCPVVTGKVKQDYPCEDCSTPIESSGRMETGTIRFGNDWQGIVIRGDDCAKFICSLKRHLLKADDHSVQMYGKQLIELLERCQDGKDVVADNTMKEYTECLKEESK